MERRSVERDGTITRTLVSGDLHDDLVVHTEQDVGAILDHVHELREHTTHNPNGLMRHAAKVPVTVYEQAVREGWVNDQDAWRAWLNDPDNKAFRVWKGRV